jgi:RNA polymerase sigma factor (sigma-70 family)
MGEQLWSESPFYRDLSEDQIQELYTSTVQQISRYSNIPAEDIVMNAMVKASQAAFTVYEGTDATRARRGFLFLVARRMATNYVRALPIRTLRPGRNMVSLDMPYGAEGTLDTLGDLVMSSSANEHDTLEYAQTQSILEDAIATLRPEQGTALRMHFLEEKTHAQIAQETGVPIGTVCTRVMRGRQKLRKTLQEQGYDFEALFTPSLSEPKTYFN